MERIYASAYERISIDKIKQTTNAQLSNIETQDNEAIFDLRNDLIDSRLEADKRRHTCSSLQEQLISFESTIHSQTNKVNKLECFSRKYNLRITGVPYKKDEDCIG